MAFPTTGYYPYSGNSGPLGVTGPVHDAGTYAVDSHTQSAVWDSLQLDNVSPGSVVFFDNPTVTHNYSLPNYALLGQLIHGNKIESMTVVLDAPSEMAPTYTLISHLNGTSQGNETILFYTHSDGPSIIEENGGGKLNESAWMSQRPDLMKNAKASINMEHFGAIEWKDVACPDGPQYRATGRMEPMWTNANASSKSAEFRQIYLDAFNGTPDYLRMALLEPLVVNGELSKWYGVGGSSTLGYSDIPTVGLIQSYELLLPSTLAMQQDRFGSEWWDMKQRTSKANNNVLDSYLTTPRSISPASERAKHRCPFNLPTCPGCSEPTPQLEDTDDTETTDSSPGDEYSLSDDDGLLSHSSITDSMSLASPAILRSQLKEEFRSIFFPAASSSQKDSDFMYCRFLGGKCLQSKGASMTAAVDLLCLLQMGVRRKDDILLQEASRLYDYTMTNLKIDLERPDAAHDDGLLGAIWILHFADSFTPTRGNANSTKVHKQAAEQIMLSRGSDAEFSPLAKILLYNIRLTGTSFGLISRKPVPSAGRQWAKVAGWAGSIESELIETLLRIPSLLHELDTSLEKPGNPQYDSLYSLLQSFTSVEEELNTWLTSWMRTLPGEVFHYAPASKFTHLDTLTRDATSAFPSVIEYPSFATASLQMSFWTGLMQVKQSILDLLERIHDPALFRVRRDALLEDLDQIADLLCQSAAFTTQPQYGYCGIMRCWGPVYFAAKWFHQRQRWDKLRWVHALTLAIQEEYGFTSPYDLPLGPNGVCLANG
ncbi:hypothetical protein PRZ48_013419 [Zasmidium cellare]|uniref:Uncharacterized protein n=1 Tax=Zasmidium cellare TaxID=395010 RepID=A0ABR0E110_ZASCE|nr:hypothetical protein PRZ48_013419 [Zasmidium cellare]